MSTRSLISIVEDDGSVRGIYCHCDGYPDGVGKNLFESWRNTDDIRAMMREGDASDIGDTLDDSEFFIRDKEEDRSERNSGFSFDPRDTLGEDDRPDPAKVFDLLVGRGNEQGADYLYAHIGGEWYVRTNTFGSEHRNVGEILREAA